ncbi:hypothetical protein IV203_017800 [Nitzschia inconspicua]|uniref:Uncharacterized protein n=1 Tax=Nitzschia inconspicua TaxID=303405 RepID=A0A9K3M077_9STRA|nr:hypothetical protein IV203_024866 [Nitzschia inconspicua]KAG7371659.1 hypothetical protein IV203_017800 [Nitzschia inconspicua]
MMKIRSQILSLFVLQQSVSCVLAFILSHGPAKTTTTSFSTALPYRINENEAYQRDQFIAPFDIGTFGSNAPPRTMAPPPMRRRGGPPPPQSRKMYDLSQRKRQAAPRGAVQGAIDSLWGPATPKNIQGLEDVDH